MTDHLHNSHIHSPMNVITFSNPDTKVLHSCILNVIKMYPYLTPSKRQISASMLKLHLSILEFWFVLIGPFTDKSLVHTVTVGLSLSGPRSHTHSVLFSHWCADSTWRRTCADSLSVHASSMAQLRHTELSCCCCCCWRCHCCSTTTRREIWAYRE